MNTRYIDPANLPRIESMSYVSDIKRHVFRSLLVAHFIGLALTIGIRFAGLVIERVTSTPDLQSLSFGRDLTGILARSLTLPGFLLTVATGILMVLLRYGRHPPVWIWIKIGLTTAALSLATPLVAPALEAAREWAHWSVQHGQLAPQFQEAIARASFYGSIVFALFLLNIPVAVWKPFSGSKLSQLISGRTRRTSTLHVEGGPDREAELVGRDVDRAGAVAAGITRRPEVGFGALDITSLAGRCTTSAANLNKDQQS
jgi:hypothetical protein